MLYVCTQLKLSTLITPVLNAALFAIARTLKQPSCQSADTWIKKLWYIHTGECHSAIKANAFEWVLMRWVSLEPIIQSEISHKEDKYHLLMHIYGIWRWYIWSCVQGSKGDTDVKNRFLDSVGEGEDGTIWENSIETYAAPYVQQITSAESAVWSRAPTARALWQAGETGWRGSWAGGFMMEATHVYLFIGMHVPIHKMHGKNHHDIVSNCSPIKINFCFQK